MDSVIIPKYRATRRQITIKGICTLAFTKGFIHSFILSYAEETVEVNLVN